MQGICVVGDNCIDIYSGLRETCFLGGNGVNTAIAICGKKTVCAYIGVAGNDAAGNAILKALPEMGIGIERMIQIEGPTGWTKIALVDGDRNFIDENIGVQQFFNLMPEDYRYMSGFAWVHHTAFSNWPTAIETGIPSYYKKMAEQFDAVSLLPGGFSVDFSDRQDERLFETAGEKVNIGFFSRPPMEGEELMRTCRGLYEFGFSLVVITMGKCGSAAWDNKKLYRQEAIPTRVVDTLGAGDAFIGAFLSRWVGEENIPAALFSGASLAARVCAKEEGYRPVKIDLEDQI